MNGTAVLAHAVSIAHGIGASLACVACFYIGGLALVPRRWDKTLGAGESPAMFGAALYVILCWFGIASGVPLPPLAAGFVVAVLILAVARYRRLAITLKAHVARGWVAAGWVLTFCLLYILTYLFTIPPATPEYLPPAWTGNIDLLSYSQYTRHLMRLGPTNLVGFSYMNFVYLQAPAVFYILGWLSFLFGQDPMRAAMPAQFALTALIGLFAARISRSVFALSRAAAVAIACIVVSGAFLRYIAGGYFLSTLMSTPVLLYLLWTTVACRPQRFLDGGLAIRFGSAYVLLLFMYPFLLFAGLVAQAAAIVLMLIVRLQNDASGPAWREIRRDAVRVSGAAMVPLALLVGAFFQRFTWSIDMVRALSRPGVAGWALDIISPLAILGLPATMNDHGQCPGCVGIEVINPAYWVLAAAAFCAIGLALGFLYVWRFRQQTTPAQRTLTALAGGAFILYGATFLRFGPSYQQWKFASYSALPLSFAVWAGGLHLVQRSALYARATRTSRGHRLVTALLALVGVGVVGGNLLAHALGDPVLFRLSGTIRNLATVDALRSFRELSIKMDDESFRNSTSLALYFLPTKRVHVISPTFSPSEPLSFEQVSRQRPLLIQGYGCEGVGHDDTLAVPDLGCLLFASPSLVLDTSYPFNQTYLFVGFEGLGRRELQGRWNSSSTVSFELTADLQRAWVLQDAYVNLLVNPYLPPGTTRQRLVFSWGRDQHVEVSIGAREWISLPVRGADWTGERVRTLPFSIDLPDAVAPPWMYSPERRFASEGPLAAVFEQLSMSVSPRGRAVTPVVGGGR